jgi:hypothetical protein
MAKIQANSLCIYTVQASSDEPFVIYYDSLPDYNAGSNPEVVGELAILVTSTGKFVGAYNFTVIGWRPLQYAVLSYATQSSLQVDRGINTISYRDKCTGKSKSLVTSSALTWSMSVSALYDYENLISEGETTGRSLLEIARKKHFTVSKFDVGTISYYGICLISNVNISGGVDDVVTYSATLRGYGTLYQAT